MHAAQNSTPVLCVGDSCIYILSYIPYRNKYITVRSGDRTSHVCKNATASLINTPRASTDSLLLYRLRNCLTSLLSACRLYSPHRGAKVRPEMFQSALRHSRWEEQPVIVQNKITAVLYEFAHRSHLFAFLYHHRLHSIVIPVETIAPERGPYGGGGPHQVSKGPQENDQELGGPQLLLIGPPKFHYLSKIPYIKFKLD